MDTIVLFLPETEKKKSGTCEEFEINKKFLKLIYCREKHTKFNNFFFKRKIKKELKNAVVFDNAFSENINCRKIYGSGKKLAVFHLNNILKKMLADESVGIFSTNVNQLKEIKEVIMNYKRIVIITDEENYEAFKKELLENYGISGAVSQNANTPMKNAVIMPECKITPTKVEGKILNLSNINCAEALPHSSIKYNPPRELKIISEIMRKGDVLETVSDFLGISYNKINVSSVNFNKVIKKEN